MKSNKSTSRKEKPIKPINRKANIRKKASMSKIAILLMGVIVLVISTIIGYKWISTLIEGLPFKEEELLQKTESSRFLLLRNIDACDQIDHNCRCEIFPKFPGVLPKQFNLEINNTNKNISLKLNEKIINSITIDNTINVLEYVHTRKEKGKADFCLKRDDLTIRFDTYPSYEKKRQIGYSEGIKLENDIFLFSRCYVKEIYVEPTGYVPIPGSKLPTGKYEKTCEEDPEDKEVFQNLEAFIGNMPKCKEGRKEAIISFRNLLLHQGKMKIEIGENFAIKVNSNGIALLEDGNIAKDFSITSQLFESDKCPGDIEIEITIKDLFSDKLVSCDGKEHVFKSGDSVNVIFQDFQRCLKKI